MLVTLILLFVGVTFGSIPAVIPNTYVQDHAGVLSPEDEGQIQTLLTNLKQKHNLEFGVATVDTTQPRAIEEYALEMARTYGIGSKDGEKRGILLLLAIKDRKWRFEISRHMEAVLTDGQSGAIGRNVLVPNLKLAKDSAGYRDAILKTVSATDGQISQRIEAESIGNTDNSALGGIALGILASVAGIGVLGGGAFGLVRWRRRKREEEEEALAKELAEEEARLEELAHREWVRSERVKREAREAKEKAEREAHEAWLKTPEGIAETARLAKIEAERAEKERIRREQEREAERKRVLAHQAWLKTPEGIADTQRKAREEAERKARREREAEQERKREQERQERRRKERAEEDERAARRRRDESSSYSSSSSSYSSSSSSSYDSGSSSSSGSFGGGSDYSGGGSSGSW